MCLLLLICQDVPVVIVRNKMDTLVAEGGGRLGERSADLERQVGKTNGPYMVPPPPL